MKQPNFLGLIISLLLLISLSACSTSSALLPVSGEQNISSGSSFGQSFTAQYRGLAGISVLLAPVGNNNEGSLILHLQSSPQSTDDIAHAILPIAEITQQKYYRFDFAPQNDSQRKDYFLQVEVEGGAQVKIMTAPAGSYLDGALYENLSPQDSQLDFQLNYDPKSYFLGLEQLFAGWLEVLSIGLILFILPGWALFSLLWRKWGDLSWIVKLGLAGGLSLAIYPLFMLWTNLVGIHLGLWYALIPPIFGILTLSWKHRNLFHIIVDVFRKRVNPFASFKFPAFSILIADGSLLIILGLIIAARFWSIRSLDVPLFGDSYQHSMITQLIVDHGGLFTSWEPYADLVTFTYHFGFHSFAAVYHWISGATVEKSILWTGQLINVIAVLGLYPLAIKITGNRWSGVVAVLIAGLLSPMPMDYLNWGRYTQLAGQAILPAVIWVSWMILDRPQPDQPATKYFTKLVLWRYLDLDIESLVVIWLLLGGLALTHYRILIITLLFFPAYGLFMLFRKRLTFWIGRMIWIGLGGAILFLPWFIHVFGGRILGIFASQLTATPAAISANTELAYSTSDLSTYLPIAIWIILIASLLFGFLKKNREIAIYAVWWAMIFIATNPNLIRLPGMGAITNFTILIAVYILAGVVIGVAISWLPYINIPKDARASDGLSRFLNSVIVPGMLTITVCALGIWGASRRIREINIPAFALVTRPDLRAMQWIQVSTNPESRFLISSFSAYGGSAVVGSDAGWWIPLLAFRHTTVPPLTYAAELGITPDFPQKVKTINDVVHTNGISGAETLALLKAENIQYIYIGQQQGGVNYAGPNPLDPAKMLVDGSFQLVYHQDRVWIFEVKP